MARRRIKTANRPTVQSVASAACVGGGVASLVLFLLGALLIAASVLKGLALWRGELPGAIALFPEGTREFVVIAEAFLGVWWVSGFAETMARRIASVVFLLFAGIAGLMVWRGVGSCGCFGSLRTNPLELLLFDLVILGLLYGLSSRPISKERGASSIGIVETVCRVTAAGCMAVGVVLLADEDRPPLLQLGSDDVPKAVGKRLGDLGKIDIAKKLETGDWFVVFWSHDCPKCVMELPNVIRLAADAKASSARHKVALIEIPPYGPKRPTDDSSIVFGRLDPETPWPAMTPFWIELHNGRVRRQALAAFDLMGTEGRS